MAVSDIHMEELLRVIVDVYPSPLLVFNQDVLLQAYNKAAEPLVGPDPIKVLNHRGGDVLCCVHRSDHPDGCGHGEACRTCMVRGSINEAFAGHKVTRGKARVEMRDRAGKHSEVFLLITAAPFKYHDLDLALVVLEDMSQVMELRSLLPMCASCKKVRNDQDYWSKVESYLHDQLEVDVSHGLCPDCADKFIRDFQKDHPGR